MQVPNRVARPNRLKYSDSVLKASAISSEAPLYRPKLSIRTTIYRRSATRRWPTLSTHLQFHRPEPHGDVHRHHRIFRHNDHPSRKSYLKTCSDPPTVPFPIHSKEGRGRINRNTIGINNLRLIRLRPYLVGGWGRFDFLRETIRTRTSSLYIVNNHLFPP